MKLTGKRLACVFAVVTTAAVVAPATGLGASDLSITKNDSADPVREGQNFSYEITVANVGPDLATNVQVRDKLHGSLDFVSVTTTKGSCNRNGNTVRCFIGSLANDAEATVRITVKATKAGTIENIATATSDDDDPYGPNDSASETTKILASPGPSPVPSCAGKKATLVGTPGADVLRGTDHRDVIVGLGGDDLIKGYAGNDIVCGTGGKDVIKGHLGSDILKGQRGDDRIRGGRGSDVLAGARGHDLLSGGDGHDTLRAGPGRDRLRGGSGDDALRGGRGNDRCRGGGGFDDFTSC